MKSFIMLFSNTIVARLESPEALKQWHVRAECVVVSCLANERILITVADHQNILQHIRAAQAVLYPFQIGLRANGRHCHCH